MSIRVVMCLAVCVATAQAAEPTAEQIIRADQVRAERAAKVRNGLKACVGCDLFQVDLSYANVGGADFSRARLRQADLELLEADRARFRGANLSVANAFGARFAHADFRGADLSQANFVGAYLGFANFAGATLRGAVLSGADLEQAAGLTNAQLAEACGDETTRLPKGLRIPDC